MARITIRLSQPDLRGPVETLFPNGALIVDGYGRKAVQTIQTGLWADARFVRATGKSRKAWAYEVDRRGLGLTVYNTANNRYGTLYAQYVHYAGTPRSALVVDGIPAALKPIGDEMLKALARDFKRGLAARKRVVTRG